MPVISHEALHHRGVEALAHLGEAGVDHDVPVRRDLDEGLAGFGHAVADADVLDAAGDAGVLGEP